MTHLMAQRASTTILSYRRAADVAAFHSGVSLHSHTHHSRETVSELKTQIARVPVLAAMFERELQGRLRSTTHAVDLSRSAWRPPVSPRDVFASEAGQIESRLELEPIVSVTDHDTIAAGLDLQEYYVPSRAPVSVEWTVPFGPTYFHLGIHNLPAARASEWWQRLEAYTSQPAERALAERLAELDEMPDVLVVFNHPMWDLADVGVGTHHAWVRRFLEVHRHRLHAVEINGYRRQAENDQSWTLASAQDLPVVSGGDRHGLEPNAMLNVSTARTMSDFVAEIRRGLSTIVVMPEYRRHIWGRTLASAADVLSRRRAPFGGWQYWTDRVHCEADGRSYPLSDHWPGGGPWRVRSFVAAFRLLTRPPLLNVLCGVLTLADRSRA